jgi:hypothetical protein
MSIFSHIVKAIFGSSEEHHTTAAKPISRDQVEKQIAKLAVSVNEQHNWRTSVVDLLKLLNVDSSLEAREELAKELGRRGRFTGTDDENEWLHDAVMEKLAETGGKVPDSFKD